MDGGFKNLRPFVKGVLPLVNSTQNICTPSLTFTLNFMVHNIFKYLMVLGVVLTGFQCSAFVSKKDKEKDKKKNETTVVIQDTIKIIIEKDISVGDTLVFDDFDEDDNEDDDNSSIASNDGRKAAVTMGSIESTPKQQEVFFNSGTSISDSSQEEVIAEPGEVFENVFSEKVDLKIFPNPSAQNNGPVTVTHQLNSTVTISVFSLTGQLIRSTNTTEKSVQFYDLKAGTYLIHVSNNELSDSKRLLVQ